MPDIETADLYQKAVMWEVSGLDAYAEVLRTNPPVELCVRWVFERDRVTDKNGNSIMVEAWVAVDRRVEENSIMWYGDLAAWSGTSPSQGQNELMQVKCYEEVPDIKGREIRRIVGLVRYKGTLPDLAA